MMPCPGRDAEARNLRISVEADMVSPANTGAVMRISVQPRLATARWLTSRTLMPTTIANVRGLETMGLPNSVFRAYSTSKWIGCVFIVSSVNQLLSRSEEHTSELQ